MIESGKTYRVNHSRKGKFTMRVTAVRGEWIDGLIIDGRAKYMSMQNQGEGYVGDEVTVRASLATFEEVPDAATANPDPA